MAELLVKDTFKEKIFDFENEREWTYKGKRPAIIDFYADWCGPCRAVAPVIDELSNEYKGIIDIYKVDTEDQKELASMFNVRSIPSILFIPVSGQPKMATGAMPKESFKQAIIDIFKIK
jgi:thioredoxin